MKSLFFILVGVSIFSNFGATAQARPLKTSDCPRTWQGAPLVSAREPRAIVIGSAPEILVCTYRGTITPEACDKLPFPAQIDGPNGRALCRNYFDDKADMILEILKPIEPSTYGYGGVQMFSIVNMIGFLLVWMPLLGFIIFAIAIYKFRNEKPGRLLPLFVSCAVLFIFSVYSYRMAQWERTVAGPIRIDLLLFLPVVAIATIIGLFRLGSLRAERARRKNQ